MYKLVIFDIDGTMLDSNYSVLKGLQNLILKEKGEEYPLEELRFAFGADGVGTMERVGLTAEHVPLWIKEIQGLTSTLEIYDGIMDTLEEIKKRGYPMAIVTSRFREEMDTVVSKLDFYPYFDFDISADDVTNTKPHPEGMLATAKHFDVDPHEILYIGDSIFDYECAKNSGVDFLLAQWGANEQLKEMCETQVAHPSEILNYL